MDFRGGVILPVGQKVELKVEKEVEGEPKKKVITGARAIAEAVRLADVDVIAAYPIRPYTGIMNALAQMIADGEFDAEIISADGEHSQFEIVKHAAAVGARTFVGSSGTGAVFAAEAMVATALAQVPVVAVIGNRALDDPGNFAMEWNDAFLYRDVGWLMFWAETPQEAFDMTLMCYRIAEDHKVLLPAMLCVDGAPVTHIASPVEIPPEEKPKEFLPPYKPPYPLDPDFGPVVKAQHIAPSLIGPELRKLVDVAMKRARDVIIQAHEEFSKVFGRSYPPFIEADYLDDAEVVLITMGANSKNVRELVKRKREEGVKIGFVKIRTFRPFPTEELQEVLQNVKAVGVVEYDYSFGSPYHGGVLFNEVRSALYGMENSPLVLDFIVVGGRELSLANYEVAVDRVVKAAESGRVEKPVSWLGLRGRDV